MESKGAPKVVLELRPGFTPERAEIVIHYFEIPGGWPAVLQILIAATGPAMEKAFEQIRQLPDEQRIVLASSMNDVRH